MAFSNFRWNVAARVALMAACLFASIWGWNEPTWLATPLLATVLTLFLGVELVRYVERSHRELTSFLRSVAHHDYSVPTTRLNRGVVFDELEDAYRTLATEFTRLNAQKAANYQYLEAVIEHLGIALVCFDETGAVRIMNDPARRLFQLQHAHSMGSFSRVDERLPAMLEQMRHDDRELLKTQAGDETLQLVLYATTFSVLDTQYKLVSIQNIRDELEQREMESWQKLVRVLTHEIMNSMTPIASLSNLMQETLGTGDAASGQQLDAETRTDLQRSANAVYTRSTGLIEFVKAYRNFSSMPIPAPARVGTSTVLEGARRLMLESLAAHAIHCEIRCETPEPVIHADPKQVEQVLINLMRNAVEALADTQGARISLEAQHHPHGRVAIQVCDNGPGIDSATAENIFVPFFTTKRGGTGVGLSISRQLIRGNRGFLSYRKAEPQGSVFTLLLPSSS